MPAAVVVVAVVVVVVVVLPVGRGVVPESVWAELGCGL